jgi:hypothetical protein
MVWNDILHLCRQFLPTFSLPAPRCFAYFFLFCRCQLDCLLNFPGLTWRSTFKLLRTNVNFLFSLCLTPSRRNDILSRGVGLLLFGHSLNLIQVQIELFDGGWIYHTAVVGIINVILILNSVVLMAHHRTIHRLLSWPLLIISHIYFSLFEFCL